MIDYKDALEQARRALRPPLDAFERLTERRDWKRRNHRITAGILGLVIAAGGLFAVVIAFRNESQGRPATPCSQPSAGLTGWWKGDGSPSDDAGGRDATLHGDATFGPGLIGDAFVLDGHGDFASVPDDPALNVGTGDFTVHLWVYFNTTEGEQILIEKWVQRSFSGPARSFGWSLTKLENNSIGLAGTGFGVFSGPLDIPTGTWIHLAARRSANKFEVFMNGRMIASGKAPKRLLVYLDSPASLKFGHRGGPEDTPGSIDERGFFLDGRIDEVKLIVDRALSDEEIRAAADAATSGRC